MFRKPNGTERHRIVIDNIGPASASLSRLKNEFRLQIILKGATRRTLRETLNIALFDAEHQGCDLRTINVEIDPVNLM